MMTLNRILTAINNKWIRLLNVRVTMIFVFVCFNQLVQAAPIVILVNDANGQPLNQAIVEVIRPNSSINAMAVSSEPVVMDQVNKRFVPDLILIQQGQSIVFPNSDNIRHHVYSFSKAKTFELKLYAGEPKKPIKFETNGVVIVGCNIHDSMIGSIYVTKQTAMMTDDKGKVRLDFDPMIDKVSIWHPLQKNNPEQRKIIDLKDYQLAEDKEAYIISIDINEPLPRDTFRDTFRDTD
ncbi:MAG: methylamine utilization protein [Pseudomonadota bacterium]|nr:methylamine utilization protein [Pseudomonadota bacterium]MDO7710473.1 methylamine utilization protein [Pseudomonadota bacterium]